MKKILLPLLVFSLTTSIVSFAQPNTLSANERLAIVTPNAPAPTGTFSQAIRAGDVVYISGQIPTDLKTGELVSGDFQKQVRQAFTNLSEIAKASGGDLNNVVKLTIYVTDLGNMSVINDVMTEYFHQPYPARATVEVKALAKKAEIEVDAIMVKKSGT